MCHFCSLNKKPWPSFHWRSKLVLLASSWLLVWTKLESLQSLLSFIITFGSKGYNHIWFRRLQSHLVFQEFTVTFSHQVYNLGVWDGRHCEKLPSKHLITLEVEQGSAESQGSQSRLQGVQDSSVLSPDMFRHGKSQLILFAGLEFATQRYYLSPNRSSW